MPDFFKDFKKWTKDSPENAHTIAMYNRGMLTLFEALRNIDRNNTETARKDAERRKA